MILMIKQGVRYLNPGIKIKNLWVLMWWMINNKHQAILFSNSILHLEKIWNLVDHQTCKVLKWWIKQQEMVMDMVKQIKTYLGMQKHIKEWLEQEVQITVGVRKAKRQQLISQILRKFKKLNNPNRFFLWILMLQME